MTTAEFPDVRWHGHWVAPDVPDFVIDPHSVGGDLPPAGPSRVQFRRVFDVENVPARVPLRLSADSRYVLWVNGAEVGRGPIRSQPRRLRYDEYDIADHLQPGANVLSVLVTYYGHANSFWQPAASSGVMGRDAQLVLEARIGADWLVSDQHWRAQRSPAWRGLAAGQALEGVPIELLDARELDPGWIDPDFDDSSWVAATVIEATHDGARGESRPPVDPYGAMLPRGIGMLSGDRVAPQTLTLQTAPAVPDLPDHPADRLVQQLRNAGDKQAVQLPLTVDPEPGLSDPDSRRLRPDRGRPRRAGGRRPERGPAGPVLPRVRALRRRRRPGRVGTPQQRQLHHPRLRRPIQGGRHQRAAADLPDGAPGNRGGHDP